MSESNATIDALNWLWEKASKLPDVPMPSILAIVIVVVLAAPLAVRIWKSWRDLFRRSDDDRDERRVHSNWRSNNEFAYDLRNSELIQRNPWLISELINIDVQVQSTNNILNEIKNELEAVKKIATEARDKTQVTISILRRKNSRQPPKAR